MDAIRAIDLPTLANVSADYPGRTVTLDGEVSALLLSLVGLGADYHNWQASPYLFPVDKLYIDAVLDKAARQLMMTNIGEFVSYVTSNPPEFTLACDGSTYARADYPALYAVLDTSYIVDADSFVVPDFRGRSPLGVGQGDGLSDRAVNEQGGEEAHSLTENENAAHTHTYNVPNIPTLVFEPGEVPVPTADLFPSVTGSSGLGTAHNTMHPFTVVKMAVRYQ